MRAVSNIRSQNADYNNAYNTKTVSVDFNLMTNKIKSIECEQLEWKLLELEWKLIPGI